MNNKHWKWLCAFAVAPQPRSWMSGWRAVWQRPNVTRPQMWIFPVMTTKPPSTPWPRHAAMATCATLRPVCPEPPDWAWPSPPSLLCLWPTFWFDRMRHEMMNDKVHTHIKHTQKHTHTHTHGSCVHYSWGVLHFLISHKCLYQLRCNSSFCFCIILDLSLTCPYPHFTTRDIKISSIKRVRNADFKDDFFLSPTHLKCHAGNFLYLNEQYKV